MIQPRPYIIDKTGQVRLRDPDSQFVPAVVSQGRVVPESCWICSGDCSAEAGGPPLSCPNDPANAPEFRT